MIRCFSFLLGLLLLVGCERPQPTRPSDINVGGNESSVPTRQETFAEARARHQVKPVRRAAEQVPLDVPPANTFTIVKYKSPVGMLEAYLTPNPKDGKKHPAILWITGGDCNSIGDVWSPSDPKNDQSAAQYRNAGIVMMFPSLRGGNKNPGKRESFFGEVDDVLAARKFLADQPHVDPDRIYLGGHSTGGTLALLVAETGAKFRAVFSFGPVDEVDGYGPDYCFFDLNDKEAVRVRSPLHWLSGVQCRTLVLEGNKQGNLLSVAQMSSISRNDKLSFYSINGGSHFDILAPVNTALAQAILKDTGAECTISLPAQVGRFRAEDLGQKR
jgi:alpha/beta superfamily hydrolase